MMYSTQQLTQCVSDENLNDLLVEQFASLSQSELLTHYHLRQTIVYDPRVDPEHTEKSFIDSILDNTFCFNHEVYRLTSPVNWKDNPSQDIEWLIMMHKCYYFVGLGMHYRQYKDKRYLHQWVALTRSWIEQTEPGFIASDVTGRRVQNWIFAFYYFVHTNPEPCITAEFLSLLLCSLHRQVDYLVNNLTAARNHRTLELYAIFLAAIVFPEFKQSSEWLSFASRAMTENVRNDFLSDGVHCELSTYYHHTVLKNIIKFKCLASENGIDIDSGFDEIVMKALQFSAYLHKPDGSIPSLSDGDTGNFYHLLDLGFQLYGNDQLRFVSSEGKTGVALTPRSRVFANSGYCIMRSPWNTELEPWHDARYLVFDCGPLGAGNHGHLDLLNIEMAAYGRSLIVDPGRYTYDESGPVNWRVLFRSTGYHNTVQIDGRNQTRYSFNAQRNKYAISGPQAKPDLRSFITTSDFDYVHGVALSHEYSAIHERRIFFAAGDYWLICDDLHDQNAINHHYRLRFHLSPEAQDKVSTCIDQDCWVIDSPQLSLIQTHQTASRYRVEQGYVSPQYGIKHKAPVICFERFAGTTVFETLLFPYKTCRPSITVQSLDQQPDHRSSALLCTIETGGQIYHDYYFIAQGQSRQQWRHEAIECGGNFCFIRFNQNNTIVNSFATQNSTITVNGQSVQYQGQRP